MVTYSALNILIDPLDEDDEEYQMIAEYLENSKDSGIQNFQSS
jgi:hypothetical protein